MRQRRKTYWTSWLLMGVCMALATSACSRNAGRQPAADRGITPSKKPQVYVVNYPLKYFADRIGGDLVDVHFPAPPAIDPAFWKPNVETIGAYQTADLILLNGADYAKWIATTTLPGSKMFDTTSDIRDKYLRVQDAVTHSHGPQGEHNHAETAFTTWLDMQIAISQATSIKAALQKLLPDKRELLSGNLSELVSDLSALDKQLENLAAGNRDLPLVASHPVYQYLAKRYGLNVKNVHWEPNELPDGKSWQQFQQLITTHPAKVMIWEGPPIDPIVSQLTEHGLQCCTFDPCGNTPAEGDFLSIMSNNVMNLKASLRDRDDIAL